MGQFIDQMADRYRQGYCEVGKTLDPWESLSEIRKSIYRARMRHLMEGFPEPTAEMLSAADSAIPRFELDDATGHRLMGVDGALEAWNAMIAEAVR